MWYKGKFRCGHAGRFFSENGSVSEYTLMEYFDEVCDKCFEDIHINKKLPKLRGSKNQVEWAEEIRDSVIGKFSNTLANEHILHFILEVDNHTGITYRDIFVAYDAILTKQSAEHFIMGRNYTVLDWILFELNEL